MTENETGRQSRETAARTVRHGADGRSVRLKYSHIVPADATHPAEYGIHYATEYGAPVVPLYAARDGGCMCDRGRACASPGKHPRLRRTRADWTDPGRIRHWWRCLPLDNIGIRTGYPLPDGRYLVVVDIDPRHDGDAWLDDFEGRHGALDTYTVRTGGGGWHFYFAAAAPLRSCTIAPGAELKGRGSLVVAPPSMHVTGRRYEVECDAPLADLPDAIAALIPTPAPIDPAAGGDGIDPTTLDALTAIPPDCPYDEWVRVGMALHHADPDGGLHVWDTWSAAGRKYRPGETGRKWQSFGGGSGAVTLATVRRIAEAYGWTDPHTEHGATVAARLLRAREVAA